MSDVVVTIPRHLWEAWLAEGDLPGQEAQYESHFWIPFPPPSQIDPGERVYVVAHNRLRGYAPLVRIEERCQLNPGRSCLVRAGGAVAVTIPKAIRGFQGLRYAWWNRADEVPFPTWEQP